MQKVDLLQGLAVPKSVLFETNIERMMDSRLTWLGISISDLTNGVKTRVAPESQASVDTYIPKLMTLAEQLRPDFQAYWHGKSFDRNLSVGHRSLESLMASHEMTVIAAFLALDWIIREPTKAEEALNRGYNIVEFGLMGEETRKRVEERRAELIRLNLI